MTGGCLSKESGEDISTTGYNTARLLTWSMTSRAVIINGCVLLLLLDKGNIRLGDCDCC